jgi:hypothetical protein
MSALTQSTALRIRCLERRWTILILLFVPTGINNIERQTVSALAPDLRFALHVSEHDYSSGDERSEQKHTLSQHITNKRSSFRSFSFILIWLQATSSFQ